MKIVAVDTNVLVDFQLQRAPNFPKAKKLLDDCLDNKVEVFIPQIVFPEYEWVLRSYYKQPKEKIVAFLEELLILEALLMSDKSEMQQALVLFKSTNIEFTDAIILTQVRNSKPDDFLTFDDNLRKLYLNSI